MQFNYGDAITICPIIFMATLSLFLLVIDASIKKSANAAYWLTLAGLAIAASLTPYTYFASGNAFGGMVFTGRFPAFFDIVFITSAALTVFLSKSYLEKEGAHFGEYYALVIFGTIGMMLMASARDLIILFLGLELLSISLYVLAGYLRTDSKSNEASLKYFLLGAFATGFLLYGIALIYGTAGSTNLAVVLSRIATLQSNVVFWIGATFVFIGLGFKVSAVPFHMWVPDVYEGSPTIVSGFMSTGGKAAAFSGLVLVFSYSVHPTWQLQLIIAYVAAFTMLTGNIIAILQQNIKRMLAYSSIAHAGYALVGIAAANDLGRTGVMYYMLAYTFMQIGAFGVVSLLESKEGRFLSLTDYEGLAYDRPFIAALMAIFMFSLAGLPPFAGFFGKYYLFASAVQANMTWLAIIGVLASIISVYFYIGVVVNMYFKELPEGIAKADISKIGVIALIVAAALTIELGITPGFVVGFTQKLF